MSLISDRNALFLKQDNQSKDEHTYRGGGEDSCRVLGFLPCIKDTLIRISSENLRNQAHREVNSAVHALNSCIFLYVPLTPWILNQMS